MKFADVSHECYHNLVFIEKSLSFSNINFNNLKTAFKNRLLKSSLKIYRCFYLLFCFSPALSDLQNFIIFLLVETRSKLLKHVQKCDFENNLLNRNLFNPLYFETTRTQRITNKLNQQFARLFIVLLTKRILRKHLFNQRQF